MVPLCDHVPDWQPRILLGMVEARSVNVKTTTTTTTCYSVPFGVNVEWSTGGTTSGTTGAKSSIAAIMSYYIILFSLTLGGRGVL